MRTKKIGVFIFCLLWVFSACKKQIHFEDSLSQQALATVVIRQYVTAISKQDEARLLALMAFPFLLEERVLQSADDLREEIPPPEPDAEVLPIVHIRFHTLEEIQAKNLFFKEYLERYQLTTDIYVAVVTLMEGGREAPGILLLQLTSAGEWKVRGMLPEDSLSANPYP